MKSFVVAVVGATGVVGREMIRVLEQRNFPVETLRPLASPKSAGLTVTFRGKPVPVQALDEKTLDPKAFEGVDIALFSAGSEASRLWAPIAAKAGALVIDNSSAWRMDPDVPLCVPEVNIDAARRPKKNIIANPNCSTIQMLVALKPIHDQAKIRRIVVSTYQGASGAGAKAVAALQDQWKQLAAGQKVEHGALGGQLAGSLLMEWKRDLESGYQEEELKLVFETRKIMGDDSIRVSPTAVRVAVETGHSESVTIEAERSITPAEVREWLSKAPGVEVVDDFAKGVYPKPVDVVGKDNVLVGRIREDIGNPGGIQMWIVGDNLRKGAALNAVQIAEGLLLNG